MGLIIRLIIQTIRRDPTGSDQIDKAFNLSRPDPSGADQIDAEHQPTDVAVRLRILAGPDIGLCASLSSYATNGRLA